MQKRLFDKICTNTRLKFLASQKVKFLTLINDIYQNLTTNILPNDELLQATPPDCFGKQSHSLIDVTRTETLS